MHNNVQDTPKYCDSDNQSRLRAQRTTVRYLRSTSELTGLGKARASSTLSKRMTLVHKPWPLQKGLRNIWVCLRREPKKWNVLPVAFGLPRQNKPTKGTSKTTRSSPHPPTPPQPHPIPPPHPPPPPQPPNPQSERQLRIGLPVLQDGGQLHGARHILS